MRESADGGRWEFVEIGPEVVDRMPLEREPSAATVASYVLTHGASRAWEAINNQLTKAQGGLFWIGGSAGAGKTHFLNYVLALSARAAAPGDETARYITLPIEVTGGVSAAEIDRRILESIAKALTGDDHQPALWRQMRGREALTIAFDRARRQGVKGVTIAIDLGLDETDPAREILSALVEVGRSVKKLRLIVAAAGRGAAPDQAQVFNVTPLADEEIAVAVGRVRQIHDSALHTVDGLYGKLDGVWDTRAIYPFHPTTASVVRSLYESNAKVGTLAKAVREVVEPWYGKRDFQRLIMPAALMRSPAIRDALDVRLGAMGRAAFKVANAAAVTLDEHAPGIFQTLVDTLVLLQVGGAAAPISLIELAARIDSSLKGAAGNGLANALTALADRTRGVLVYDALAQSARFNPGGSGAPEVARFNSALALLSTFDPSLTAAHETADLKAKLARLHAALASVIERACGQQEMLGAAMRESGGHPSLELQQAFTGFIELAERGTDALIEAGANPSRSAAAIAVVTAYEALARVADSIPRLRSMRAYVADTGLLSDRGEYMGRDRDLVALETEGQLLVVALNPGAMAAGGRNLNAIEDRFHQFRSNYVQRYRSAHQRHRAELERLAPVAADTRSHLAALRRLNAIAALGAPAGAEISAAMAALEPRLEPCDLVDPLAPEITPRCPCCGYLLGAASPGDPLKDLSERIHRALRTKLAALTQNTISRLIRQHDSNRRLDGFLKIVQAAQTDALIRVLDDELAAYLAKLLDENSASARNGRTAKPPRPPIVN